MRRHVSTSTLIMLNAVIAVLLLLNVEARTGFLGIAEVMWVQPGCLLPLDPVYVPVSYGSVIDHLTVKTASGHRFSITEPDSFTHLVLIPYTSTRILENLLFLETWSLEHKPLGVRTVLVLFKPDHGIVPDRGWRRARKWAIGVKLDVILDRERIVVPSLRLDPCECTYQVISDSSGVVWWANPGYLGDRNLEMLVRRLAEGS